MKRKTFKDWDQPIVAGFPVGLYMHPVGANRVQRRAMRERSQKLAHETPPGSMVPAIKREVIREVPVSTQMMADHSIRVSKETVKIPTGEYEYVAAH